MLILNNVEVIYDKVFLAIKGVSIEVAPGLANDTAGSIEAARSFAGRIGRPNIFIKIPGTPEGVPAIEGVDTRAITRRLRERGTMLGVLSAGDDPAAGRARARRIEMSSVVRQVTGSEIVEFPSSGPRILVIDTGARLGSCLACSACSFSSFNSSELMGLLHCGGG